MDDDAPTFEIDLTPSPQAAGVARRFVARHAGGLPVDVAEDARLLVSELVTNAVRYGRTAIRLELRLQPPMVGVSVHDGGPELPPAQPHEPGDDAEGGRGLVIVERLSSAWGVLPDDQPPGKTVWFRIDPA